ncbi:hypothetical protein ACFW35_16615 [Fictibacillus sp. NPDC058756]|uniref:hypothetical protein n=1 Tax=Fictibacillus sp. NPDC058756 TaxID=3346625 RepID=UPI0036B04129
MDALIVGLMFFIPGILFFFWVLFKYTEEEHRKEIKKWRWFREDKSLWVWDPEFALFQKIANKSYYIAKVIIMLSALIPVIIGAFALWVFFSG